MTYTTGEFVLYLLLIDLSVGIALTTMYAWVVEMALGILYGKNKVKIDDDLMIEKLISIFIIGIVPIVGFVVLGIFMWTLGDRVESFTYAMRNLAKKKRGSIVLKGTKSDNYSDWIFV